MKLNDPLKAEDIELRIGNVKAGSGFSLLAYKTARIDRKRLDDCYSPLGWQCKYYVDSRKNVVCSIGVYDKENKQWIWKEDTGSESFTEKEKGSYSDAFKRAGFKWGIGVELYNFPFLWIKWDRWKDGKKPLARVQDWKIKYSGETFEDGFGIFDEKNNLIYKYKTFEKNKITPAQAYIALEKAKINTPKEYEAFKKECNKYAKSWNAEQQETIRQKIQKLGEII